MKPITNVTILLRDPMNPNEPGRIGKVGIEFLGDLTIILTRDEVGTIKLESVAGEPNRNWQETIEEATRTLKELHEHLGDTHIATQHCLTDMFAIHKWLTG